MSTSSGGGSIATPPKVTGWVGFIWFAAIMLMLSGAFSMIWGIVGLARDEVFLHGPKGNVLNLDYTAWGWINLIVGTAVFVAGCALFTGSRIAAFVALVLAALSAIDNLLVLNAYPVWSVLIIALDVLVIWAICFHLHELRGSE